MFTPDSLFPQKLTWEFPVPEPGAGVYMGNGTLGLMVWGSDRIYLSVSRNGFWDHRGGSSFSAEATFAELKRLLLDGKTEEAAKLFAGNKEEPGYPRPSQLPGARLELLFKDWNPVLGALNLAEGALEIELQNKSGQSAQVVVRLARDRELAWVECDPQLPEVKVELVPMWKFLGDKLQADGVQPPELRDEKISGGMLQTLPDDPALELKWQRSGNTVLLATRLGEATQKGLGDLSEGLATVAKQTLQWWKKYWDEVPRLNLPDAGIQHAYLHGIFLQAGLTPAEGVAATLVGPWMAEDAFPGWRNDYHFNINVQMIYWPCLASNRPEHLHPLWDLIKAWMPHLRETARTFFGCEDAIMLPHAVDDRGYTVDDFWTGKVDHGCTAWMAVLAWLHYRYTLEEELLRDVAWPLLTGAFNGYWAMLEEIGEGKGRRLSLPITVSPEYGGSGERSWGRDASFQLAAFHRVAAILPEAARVLGEKSDLRWEKVSRELPPYTLVEGMDFWENKKGKRVALWEGQDLEVSHRHHSHMALLYPFASIDPNAPEHRQIMKRTMQHWVSLGAGIWSGWSLPWAASLCAAADLPDAAISWLHWWRNVYNNPGHGSDHNGDFAGCSILNRGYLFPENPDERYEAVIQLDGAMGAVTAILDILVQCRRGVVVVVPRVPRRWRAFSFDGIRTEGAFLIGATVEKQALREIRVSSLKGGNLKIQQPWPKGCRAGESSYEGKIVEISTRPGESITLIPLI